MRKVLMLTATLALVSVALSGCAYIDTDPPVIHWGVPSHGGETSAKAPRAAIKMCAVLSVAQLNAASGRHFTSSETFNNPNSWGCAYSTQGDNYGGWQVALLTAYPGQSPDPPYVLLGGSDQVKPLNGIAYPAVYSANGVMLEWGKAAVLVGPFSGDKSAYVDTAHYVAVAEAVITDLS